MHPEYADNIHQHCRFLKEEILMLPIHLPLRIQDGPSNTTRFIPQFFTVQDQSFQMDTETEK